MTALVVAKFGGTSVADFDAMNRSADVVLSDASVRVVVLSASAGITNLLVALAEGLESTERQAKLDAIRAIQYAVLERLSNPAVIRDEIERLLENLAALAEAAASETSTALTDDLVSHGERVLGGDLLSEKAVVVKPGEAAQLSTPLHREAQYIAVIALFRNPDMEQDAWRLTLQRDDLDPDQPRVVELGDNRLKLRPRSED